jgi:hypothetical protein|tara:strand:+ start:58 stop:291 length:234 start_codon:yes stop_codon:yes gene_type:complete
MFTVEENFDESVVTVMDTTGKFEDVKAHFDEEGVYLVQYNETIDVDEMLLLSNEMWEMLIEAYNRTVGTYVVSGGGE